MSKVLNYLKANMERISMAVMLLAIVTAITSTAAMAWGPASRQTFTIEKPASYITFNSITNNPNYGDERNFVIAKDAANTQAGGWSDNITVQDGKEYLVRMYVHNNAGANLNLVANNVRVMANVPNNTAKNIRIDGYVSANNANPQQIWDEVNFTSDKEFNLTYIAGSTRYYNNVNANPGFTLSDSIVTKAGALVGYSKMDGNVPGCFQYSGIATFRVKASVKKTPNFTINKQVRVAGTSEWKENTTAKPGETVEYRVIYTNTGETRQNNVALRDKMDTKLKYVGGSSSLKNATSPNGIKVSDKVVEKNGINIGHYESKSNAIVYYKATVPQVKDLACGVSTFKNTATIDTDNGSKSDESKVTVNRNCEKPVDVCDLNTKAIITIDKKEFDSKKHSYNRDDCADTAVKVCKLDTKTIVTIKEKDFDSTKHSKNLDDCAGTPVSELPRTGAAAMIGTMVAMAAIGVAAAYYIRSRWEKQAQAEVAFGKSIAAPKVKLLEEHLTKKANIKK